MGRTIRALARIDIGEIVTAIDDDKRGIVEMPREIIGSYERGVLHRVCRKAVDGCRSANSFAPAGS
jgi:hypothetical protein